MMGGAESQKMELERQLTARDVELEAISEDEDVVSDSDYDTQSEYEDTDEAEQENDGNDASAAGVSVFASKDVKAKGKKNVKEIKAIGKAKSTTLLNKDANKKINATVALVHTEDPCSDKIANNNENNDRDYNKSANGDVAPDDDWGEDNKTVHFGIKNGKFIKGAQPNMKSKQQPLQSTNGTRKSMVKIDNDWDDDLSSSINDPTSNTDAMARVEVDDWGSPIDDKTKNTNMRAVSKGKSNMYTKTNVPITATDENNWDDVVTEEIFTLKGSKTILPTRSKQNSTRTNEYELKSLNLKASRSSSYDDKALNKELYNGDPLKRIKGIKTPINELEDDDDWGTDVTTENIKGPISVSAKATHLGKMPSKFKTTVLQTQNKNESHEILKYNYKSKGEAFNGTENKTEHGGRETRFINNASNIGQHTRTTSRKVQEIAHNPQITENQSKSNKAKTQEKEKGITNTKGQSGNQFSNFNRDTNQSLVVPKKEMGRNQQSLQDQHIIGSQQNTLNVKTGNAEQKTRFFIEDEIDDVKLPNDNIQRPDSEPPGKKISTKAWLPQPNNDGIKSGRKTPVKAFPKVQSWTAIEIEPVLGSDRLEKKFPFLSIDNINAEKTRQIGSSSSNHLDKNVSDSELTKPSFNESTSYPSVPKRISEGDVLSNLVKTKIEPQDKIFYGFGTGRFRNMAAAWISKFRSKKNPVKTANVAW
ncbi:uncharacterized protein LOC132719407 [Ruditapes philippinarum]|uniref:uncharacterized protein LOC132719407 n=1 Tax=Ruditapes philippinarum TaxID=129788 RepID=UPI00295BA1E6|nr:uncharacterized protein LOC132719407 [Ruditapes philippinarum]